MHTHLYRYTHERELISLFAIIDTWCDDLDDNNGTMRRSILIEVMIAAELCLLGLEKYFPKDVPIEQLLEAVREKWSENETSCALRGEARAILKRFLTAIDCNDQSQGETQLLNKFLAASTVVMQTAVEDLSLA